MDQPPSPGFIRRSTTDGPRHAETPSQALKDAEM